MDRASNLPTFDSRTPNAFMAAAGRAPRVSIVLPAWNAEATLAGCLASIARQTFTEWECIVVDDGSTDATNNLACRAAASEPRIRVVALRRSGLVAALDEGVRHSRAAFIARMDADDLMHRDRLAAQVKALERDSTLSAVGCHVRLFPRATLAPNRRAYESWLNSLRTADEVQRDAFVECPVAHPSLLMRREMAALGYVDRGWPEDYDLILRALSRGMRVGVVPERLLLWRDGAQRLSRTDPRYTLKRFVECKAHYLAAGFLSRAERYVLCGYGRTGRLMWRALAALGRHPSHIVDVKPGRIGQDIHGAPVVSPEHLPVLRGTPVVVSVARARPRANARAMLASMGFAEGRDFVCTA